MNASNVMNSFQKCDVTGQSGLHIAAITGNAAVAQIVVDYWDCKIHQTNDQGMSALEIATARGHSEVVAKIVGGRNFRWKNVSDFEALLTLAVDGGHFRLANSLALRRPSYKFRDPNAPFYLARCAKLAEKSAKLRTEWVELSMSVYKRSLVASLKPPRTTAAAGEQSPPPESGHVEDDDDGLSTAQRILADHFECPVCSEDMAAGGRRIFSCSNDHWICDACVADDRIESCPSCRERFEGARKPKRCLTAERIARQIVSGAPS